MDAEPHPEGPHCHHAPGADGHGDVTGQLDRAALRCEQQGAKLTELRRQVLRLVLESGRPIGAYDLLDRLRSERRGAAPPTVYRALDFLMEQGLIHRVERLSAFIGCPVHDDHAHAAQFLICGGCGTVQELEDPSVRDALAAAAARLGFAIQGVTIEAEGRCSSCLAARSEEGL